MNILIFMFLGLAGTWWAIGGILLIIWAVFEAIRQVFVDDGITLDDD